MATAQYIEMKKPVNWWQIIGVLVALLIPITTGLISMARTVSTQEVRLQKVETEQYNNQLKIEKEFDKIGAKLDKQADKLEDIRVSLEQKENRK